MLDPDKITRLLERVRREVDEGLSPAVQIAIGLDGDIVLDETIGAPPNSRFIAFSATKAFIAAAVWRLIDAGELAVEDPIVRFLPSFGTNGKDAVTVEQVLTHTGGFPYAPLGPPRWESRENRLEQFSRWRLTSEPGSTYLYHPTSGHWVLGEVIAEITGLDHGDAIQELVTDPLDLPRVLGVEPGDRDGIVESVAVGSLPTPQEMAEAYGFEVDIAALLPAEVGVSALTILNEPEVQRIGVPGGGGVMRARDLASLYQAFLHDERGLWSEEIRQAGTAEIRCSLPDPMGLPATRTLGLYTAGDDGHSDRRSMGRTVSSRAFGHAGAAGQLAFADPETGLSIAYLTAGLDQHLIREARRGVAIASLAADVLADRSG